jgi:hypothetical protein
MMNDWPFLPLILSRILFRLEILEERKQFLSAAHRARCGGTAQRLAPNRFDLKRPARFPIQ